MLRAYNSGTLWWAIYRIPVGHMSAIYDWLLMCTIYTMAVVCAHIHITTTNNIFLLLTNKMRKK